MKSRVIVTMAKTSARVRIAIHPIGTLNRAVPTPITGRRRKGRYPSPTLFSNAMAMA